MPYTSDDPQKDPLDKGSAAEPAQPQGNPTPGPAAPDGYAQAPHATAQKPGAPAAPVQGQQGGYYAGYAATGAGVNAAAGMGTAAGAPMGPGVAAAATPRKRHGWIVAIVAIVAFCLIIMFGMFSCSSAFSSVGTTEGSEADFLTSDAVAVINIDGDIQYDGSTSSPEGLKAQLDIAADNDHIKGVVLRVNSGGGVATAGEEMTTYVRQFKESTGKPVVVSSAATNASAAYEISSQADYIYVAKTTAIGAIGTAMQFMDYSGLMEMLGITTEDITSSSNKDSTYGTRPLTDEERAYYQAQIDQINETFIENVAQGRSMSTDEVRALATGMTFTGLDAVSNGLADEVGTLEDAQQKVADLSGCGSFTTVTLQSSSEDDLEALLGLMSKDNSTYTEELAAAIKELESNGSVSQ